MHDILEIKLLFADNTTLTINKSEVLSLNIFGLCNNIVFSKTGLEVYQACQSFDLVAKPVLYDQIKSLNAKQSMTTDWAEHAKKHQIIAIEIYTKDSLHAIIYVPYSANDSLQHIRRTSDAIVISGVAPHV